MPVLWHKRWHVFAFGVAVVNCLRGPRADLHRADTSTAVELSCWVAIRACLPTACRHAPLLPPLHSEARQVHAGRLVCSMAICLLLISICRSGSEGYLMIQTIVVV